MGDGAAQQLQRLAVRAAQQSPQAGEGPFAYVHTRGVHRSTTVMVTGREGPLRKLDERSERSEREIWIASDGSGRVEDTRAGQRTDVSGVFGPGEWHPVVSVSTDPDELEREIAPRCNAGTYSWFKSVTEVWSERVVEPQLQSALLQVLARRPDIEWLDVFSDALGRSGVAIATNLPGSRQGRYMLIFDPDTGMLLSQETEEDSTTQTTSAEDAVRQYTAFVTSGYVSTIDARP